MATLITKNSQTASAVPSAASLQVGELAVNTADGKLYTEHTGGVVKEIIPSTVVDGGITEAKIASNAVTTDKISNANVTIAKLSTTGTPSSTTYLRGDGAWVGVGGGSFDGNRQVFTSSGTFTVPAGVSRVKVTVIGAGGNGGSAASNCYPYAGGGAGGYIVDYVAVTPGGTATVTVGTNAGTRTSSFAGGTTLTAAGGNNGAAGSNSSGVLPGTSGAASVFGVPYYQNGTRNTEYSSFSSGTAMGSGGVIFLTTPSGQAYESSGAVYGHGYGLGGSNSTVPNIKNAKGYGAGGGAGGYNAAGGSGTNGLVIVEW